jgi:hypothetical protein
VVVVMMMVMTVMMVVMVVVTTVVVVVVVVALVLLVVVVVVVVEQVVAEKRCSVNVPLQLQQPSSWRWWLQAPVGTKGEVGGRSQSGKSSLCSTGVLVAVARGKASGVMGRVVVLVVATLLAVGRRRAAPARARVRTRRR